MKKQRTLSIIKPDAMKLKLSGKIFRTAILLYGKKVTLKEIIKWTRA